MYRLKYITFAVFFVLIAAAIPVWAADSQPREQSSIEQTFRKAKKDYLDKNLDSAAEQIKKGAAYMKAESEKASEKGKESLAASADELDKLAYDVKKGTVKTAKRINESFARAYAAMALESHIRSTEAWSKKETTKAGDALDSATDDLQRGIAWTGGKIDKGTKETVKKSKELAMKLKEKSSVVADDVGKGLKNTGDEIEKFAKRIAPKE